MSNVYRHKVDPMHRVTIPTGIREALGIQRGDEVLVSRVHDVVTIRKVTNRCSQCGTARRLVPIGRSENPTFHLCESCIATMYRRVSRSPRRPAERQLQLLEM